MVVHLIIAIKIELFFVGVVLINQVERTQVIKRIKTFFSVAGGEIWTLTALEL